MSDTSTMKKVQCENCKFYYFEVSGKCNLCGEYLSNTITSYGENRPTLAIWERSIAFKLRIITAFWFSAAACVPIIFFLAIFGNLFTRPDGTVQTTLLFCVLPILSAGLSGFTFGAKILDPWKIDRPRLAILPGILTAVGSYLLFLIGISLAVSNSAANRTLQERVVIATVIFVWYGFYGTILVGWLVMFTGACAGPLLLWISRLRIFESLILRSRRMNRSNANKIILILALCYFAFSIVLGFVFRK